MAGSEQQRSFAETLNDLFDENPNPRTGKRYSVLEAAAAINARVERTLPQSEWKRRRISHTYIWQLLVGDRDNPTLGHLESLADLLRVPLSRLTDREEDVEGTRHQRKLTRELQLSLRDPRFRKIVSRVRSMNEADQEVLLAFIKHAYRTAPDPDEKPTDES